MQQLLARSKTLLRGIAAYEQEMARCSDRELLTRSLSLRYRARSHESTDRLIPESFALVREAARRTIGLRHFDEQLRGGAALCRGAVIEMPTGEGKTLTATLPLYLFALHGKGAHLATANDYLARRDAEWMGPVYKLLGLTVGVVQDKMSREERRQAYAADITYGTGKKFGFDFLRDRLLRRRRHQQTFGVAGEHFETTPDDSVQRRPHFVLVDEADNLLIDEARTPLVISARPGESQTLRMERFGWCAQAARELREPDDYRCDHELRSVILSACGRQKVRALPKPEALSEVTLPELYEDVDRGLRAEVFFVRDRHYVVRDSKVVIVDEFTGRLGEGRQWRDGMHQAVEAKEGLELTMDGGQAARITIQELFMRYPHLAGMTGTAMPSRREFRRVYRLRAIEIPPHRPPQRQGLPACIFADARAKWRAIVAETQELHTIGRPVLVGTRSIDKSEHLSRLLAEAAVPHVVLNARQVATEAETIAAAGARGAVTVATNMAGRGTDIRLGPGVAELGGLHVICSELHESARIDRQLIGRCGRQGDPGSFRPFMALDDDILLAGFGPDKVNRLKRRHSGCSELKSNWDRVFYRAQRRIERRHFVDRKILMFNEDERKRRHLELGQDPYLDSPE